MAPRTLASLVLPVVPLAIAAAVLGARAERYANDKTPVALYQAFEPWILAAAGLMLAGGIVAFVLARRDRKTAAVVALSVAGLGAWQLAITGHDALAPSFSTHAIASQAKPALRADCPFYSVRTYDQTLPFYLERTVTLVEFADEMAFGLEQEPQKAVPTLEAFIERWSGETCGFALLEPSLHRELIDRGLAMRTIAQDTRRVIVGHPDKAP